MEKTRFTRDEENARLTIARSFASPADRVWQALTEPALLDQWWAPAPWKTRTITMNFRVGGYWHYAMNGPNGEQHFGRMDFLDIDPGVAYESSDVFCDADGVANESLPRQNMTLRLSTSGEITQVTCVVQYASTDDMNRILEMGMAEGLTMAHDQLEALLARN